MLIALATAAALRLFALETAPPGLYRDEARNGLDALDVLQGNHAVYFAANNGREPSYIYLTALAVSLLGRTVLAVRISAALAGTLTTIPVYLLGRSWFGPRVAFFAAWLWAVTLWPVHLSRIGLRAILLPPLLALTFWTATLAYRRRSAALWLLSGAIYGLSFYTYLAVRFTPLLLLLLLSYLLLKQPGQAKRLLRALGFFALGAGVVAAPLAFAALADPQLVLGRAGQVSIFNPQVSGGAPLTVLLQQAGRALGLFLWRGDDIVRHNPAGRPLFDLLMAGPMLIGLLWCLRRWRRAPYAVLLLWILVMLGPTVLAQDAPHFLRAVGILPAALFLPALGLSKIWEWPKLADALRRGLVLLLLLGTLIVTITDYVDYARQPRTAYLFETAAVELAQQVKADLPATAVYVDRRFREGWPAIPFLIAQEEAVVWYASSEGTGPLSPGPSRAVALYAWPYEDLSFIPRALSPPVLVAIESGSLARGDLEAEAYPLYVRYAAQVFAAPPAQVPAVQALFGGQVALHSAAARLGAGGQLRVDLEWSVQEALSGAPLAVFVHVSEPGAVGGPPLAQSDAPLAEGYWPLTMWRPGQVVHQQHVIDLQETFDSSTHQIIVGLYDAVTDVRLPASTPQGQPLGDSWRLPPASLVHEEN